MRFAQPLPSISRHTLSNSPGRHRRARPRRGCPACPMRQRLIRGPASAQSICTPSSSPAMWLRRDVARRPGPCTGTSCCSARACCCRPPQPATVTATVTRANASPRPRSRIVARERRPQLLGALDAVAVVRVIDLDRERRARGEQRRARRRPPAGTAVYCTAEIRSSVERPGSNAARIACGPMWSTTCSSRPTSAREPLLDVLVLRQRR